VNVATCPGISEAFFHYVIEPTGRIVYMLHGDWPAHIGLAREFLEYANPDLLSAGDGMVRFTPLGQTALYGIAPCETGAPHISHYDRLEP